MKTELLEEGNEGQGKGTGDGGGLCRLTISKAADDALASMVERINSDFKGGKVTRSQAVSWMLVRQSERMNDAFIKEIRADHFDEVALLEVALKQAKISGKLPPELKALLQKQLLGTDDDASKKHYKKDVDESGNH